MSLLRILAVVCLILPATQLVASWPTYLANAQRTGLTDQSIQAPLKLQWTYQTPAMPRMAWEGPRSAPIEGHEMRHRVNFDDAMHVAIADGRTYFGSTVDNRLYCVDSATGRTIWSYYSDGPIRLAPTLAHGNVYFGSDDGCVYCLNAASGELVWTQRVGPKDDRLLSRGEMISRWPVRTGVLVEGDVAYFGAGVFPHEMVFLCAANASDGKIIWRNDTISQQNAGRNDLSPQGYLLSGDQHLFVPSGRSLPVAISKQTGEIVFQKKYSWRTDAGGVVGGTKALLGDGQIYAGGPHHFLAIDQSDGSIGESWINGRQMVLAGELAYIMTGEKIICVDRARHAEASQEKQKWFLKAREARSDPKRLAEAKRKMDEFAQVGILWQYESDFDDVLIATENLVFAGGLNQVIALGRDDGQLVWQQEVQGNVRGLAAAEGRLTVSTDHGHLYTFAGSDLTGQSDPPEQIVHNWPQFEAKPFADDAWSDYYRRAAREILDVSDQRRGYCLVLGSEYGRLAFELATQSDLTVIGVEPDAEKAAAARAALEKVGLHGTKVTIVTAPLDAIPFANYFANLVVSDTVLSSGKLPGDPADVSRFLKPCGGVAILGYPVDTTTAKSVVSKSEITNWLTELFHQDEGEMVGKSSWQFVRRGKLPGAGGWSHQYGNVANTSYTPDQRIRDGLGVLWYGDPGPSAMINRHEAAGAPLSTNGRMFIQGTDKLMAYDAYNGTFLWEYQNPGAIRTGVFNNRETHNLAASDNVLYAAVSDTCQALDAESGEILAEYKVPPSADGVPRAWAYLAYDDGQLFGSSTIREELEARMRRRGLTVKSQTDAIFAVDAVSGKQMWIYRGQHLLHTTIAVGPEHVYFIDSSISPEQRQQLYLRDKQELRALTGEAAKQAEAEMKKLDLRMAVALDRRTGEKIWEKPVDVTDTTDVSAGGGSLTVMYADGHLVLCGANANGHYWRQFLSGQFETRKLVVLDSDTGEELWAKNANYMNRPAVIGNEIYAEPWAFDLHSGVEKTRPHPLTGQESQWRFSRPGHHCGVITATPNMMFFRSDFIGYYDIYNDSGTRHFSGQRLGCWVNAIPGNGLVMIPEASAGCVCQFSIASTVVMEPKTEAPTSWGIFSAVGPNTPVKRLGVNFGAPGDRKDASGREWIGYPRPATRGRLEFMFDIQPKLADGGGWYNRSVDTLEVRDTDTPWIYSSGGRGLQRFELPLRGESDGPGTYTVKLHFYADSTSPSAAFDLKLQGEQVLTSRAIASEPGNNLALIKEFPGITVEKNLVVEINPIGDELPTLSAIEVALE